MRMWAQGISTCFHDRNWVCSVRTKHEKLENKIIRERFLQDHVLMEVGDQNAAQAPINVGKGKEIANPMWTVLAI